MEDNIVSTEPIDGSEDAKVVPLRATDPGTETRTEQAPGPAYTDLSDGRPQRKPIIPAHWRTWDAAREHVRLAAARHGHAAAYHGVRAPAYLVLTVWWALVGLLHTAGRLLAWWHVPDLTRLERQAAADGLLSDHLRIHKAGKDTRTARGIILSVCLVAGVAAVVALSRGPAWVWVLLVLAGMPFLARAGRPAHKPIVAPAVLPAGVQAPSQDVITRALGSLGIAGIDRWLRDGRALSFPSPVREDGPGWRAEVDLPYGCTATQVIERREQLASGLRRPLGAVWPEPVTHEHAGRLELWVGRTDVAKARQAQWPLLCGGQADIFQPVPFGTDVRGRVVKVPLIYHNWLLGAIPRQGKTAAVRVLAAGAALDPLAEMWVHELKGSGDLDPLEKVAHRFVSGVDDASIGYAAESLRLLRAEIMRRTERLKALDRELCPDKRTTRQIAARRSLRLWPIAAIIDEAQNLFAHPDQGKAAGLDAEFVIKIGPAFGVVLVIATQRPDKASLPTGVSGNVSTRFCLKVMGQVENDVIPGTSAYKNGIRATTFRPEIDAGIGYLVGAGPAPQVTHTFYVNMTDTERIALRARALREAAGTLTGHAADQDESSARDVLADVLAVFGVDAGLQWADLAARLASRFPARWDGASADAISAECRAAGVPSVNVKSGGDVARGCRRADVETVAGAR
jgi:DNA segregation ATPase FtsK/SpoIIIE, S-DNA-T family